MYNNEDNINNAKQRELYERAWRRVQAKLSFWIHLALYLIANAALIIFATSSWNVTNWWAWPIAWGLGLLLHFLAVFIYADRASTSPVRWPRFVDEMVESEMENLDAPPLNNQWPPMPGNNYEPPFNSGPYSPDRR